MTSRRVPEPNDRPPHDKRDRARYVPVLVAFMAGALLVGRLLRGPQKFQERRTVVSAAIGALLLKWGVVWPLLLASVVFSLAMVPLLFGERKQA